MRFVFLLITIVSVSLNVSLAFDRHTAHGGPIKGLAYSSQLDLLVSTSFDYTAVLWDAATMRELRQLVAHNAAVNAASFSPDGKWLATAGDDNTINLWSVPQLTTDDYATVKPISLAGHTAKIIHLSFSSDSKTLASSSWDHRIGLWDIEARGLKNFLVGHRGSVNATVFSSDDSILYSAGVDGHVRKWRLETGEFLRSVARNGFGVNVLDVDHDLEVLAYGASNGVMGLVNLIDERPLATLWNGGPPVLAVSTDVVSGKTAFATAEGRIVIADTLAGEIERDFHAVKGPIWAIQLKTNASGLFYAGLDDWVTSISFDGFVVPHPLADIDRRFHSDDKPENGANQFLRKCSVCHSLEPSSKRRAGPTLYGVFGRKVGAVGDYPYSDELLELDLIWNEDTINLLFKDGPDIVTPGSKMPVQRIKGERDRADLISYLKRATAKK